MEKSTIIHFVRHGLVHNPKKILYGRLPGFHLSKEGINQAKNAADTLSNYPIAAVFSSPMERTIQTSEELLKKQDGLDLRISPLLMEVNCPFEGTPISEIEKRNWDVYTGTNPPYEQPSDVLTRGKAFIKSMRSEFMGKEVVAYTHGDIIALLILYALEKPITLVEKQKLYKNFIGHASITSLIYLTNSEDEIPKFIYVLPYKQG